VNPPQEGDPSYVLFIKERDSIMNELAIKAKMVVDSLNRIPGVKCNEVSLK